MDKKAKKEFIEKNDGCDKLIGRPVRINQRKLKPKKNTNYAEIIFWGDIHIGYPTSNIARASRTLEYALDNKAYIVVMGDVVESGLTQSPGGAVYRQTLNPQAQMEQAVEMLAPAAKEKLIIGLHCGNHEQRITNVTGIDISKIMAKMLGIRYLGYACWSILSLGGIRYSLYSQHGSSGSRFKHTKLKAIMDQAAWINSDILAMGHVHSLATEPIIKHGYDRTLNKVVQEKQVVILTGAYLEWDDSYAQMKAYPITKIGSPKAKLVVSEKDVHVRV